MTTTTASVDHLLQSRASSCSPELKDGPWLLDSPTLPPTYGPGASIGDPIPLHTPRQQSLPAEYRQASEEELHQRIRAAITAMTR